MQSKIWIFLFILAVSAFARGGVIFEYRNGETETIKRASFSQSTLFRSTGRSVKIEPRKIYEIEIFSDTTEIHYGETWLRARVHPRGKGEEILQPTSGWLKIGTKLNGMSSFGKISVSLTELKRIQFRIPEADPAAENGEMPRAVISNGANGNGTQSTQEQVQAQETGNLDGNGGGAGNENAQ